jgi:Ca2+-binding RTX toxin-like protein
VTGDGNGCTLDPSCTVRGDGGNDVLDLGRDGGLYAVGDHNAGGDTLGAGNDVVIGGSAGEVLIGDSSPGVDSRTTGAGNDRLVGRGGDDSLLGDSSADGAATIGPEGANDAVDGGAGDDIVSAGAGNDAVDGGPDRDRCDGQPGLDVAVRCETATGVP